MKRIVQILILALLTISCSSNTGNQKDEKNEHVGNYVLSSLKVKAEHFPEIDYAKTGMIKMELTLNEDGTLSGTSATTFFGEDGNIEEQLTGTYTRSGDEINMSIEQDLFIRDVKWTYKDRQLMNEDVETEDNQKVTRTTVFQQLQRHRRSI